MKDFDSLINGNSLKLLKMIVELAGKNKDSPVITGEDEKQIKAMLEKVMEDYKYNRMPGIDEIK